MEVTVTLNFAEQKIAKYIGTLREDENRKTHQNPRVDKKRTDYEIHIDGFGAEMAFAKMFNLYPDFTIYPRKGGGDFNRRNRSIDVKHSVHTPTWLTVQNTKIVGDVDYYVMLSGKFPTYKFVGWEYSKHVIDEKNLKQWGKYENNKMYSLPPEKLLSFEELREVLLP